MDNQKIELWLRWIAVLPGAFGAYIVVSSIAAYAYNYFSKNLMLGLLGSWICAYVFVRVGAAIAPRHRIKVAAILAILRIVFLIAIVITSPISPDYPLWRSLLVNLTISVAAVAVACLQVRKKHFI
jgi:uncharacterized membrane protein YdcZ (DUF606 family)